MFLGFALGVLGGGVDSFCWPISDYTRSSFNYRLRERGKCTLLNQSDISDFSEKSFSSC